MEFSKHINKRLENNITEMTASLSMHVNKAEKKPSVERAAVIKSLSEAIVNLLKLVEEDDGKQK